ncbi:MAG: hypothetical protein O3C10_05335, partial [Chloroflexi bacterium]|nr:hypothetical protein [Chloroflexota bacterium]
DDLSWAYWIYAGQGSITDAVRMATNSIVLGGIAGATEITREALDLVPGDSVEAGWLWTRHGTCLMDNEGDFPGADEAFLKAEAIAQSVGSKALEARANAHMCQIAFHRLDSAAAIHHGELAWTFAQEGGDPPSALRSQNFAASEYLHKGQLGQAFELIDRNLALAESVGDALWRSSSSWIGAGMAICAGDWERARAYFFDHSAGRPEMAEVGVLYELLFDSLAGRRNIKGPDVEVEFLRIRRGIQDSTSLRGLIGWWADSLGQVLAFLGGWTGTLKEIAVAEHSVLTRHHRSWEVSADMMRGVSAAALNNRVECDVFYQRLSGINRVVDAVSTMSLERVRGQLKTTMGETDAAEQHFQNAIEQTRKAGARGELAWSLMLYSEMLLDRATESAGGEGASRASAQVEIGDRAKAAKLQDEALIVTGELGMQPLTERILARREILRA